jgi:hypothetical protein
VTSTNILPHFSFFPLLFFRNSARRLLRLRQLFLQKRRQPNYKPCFPLYWPTTIGPPSKKLPRYLGRPI